MSPCGIFQFKEIYTFTQSFSSLDPVRPCGQNSHMTKRLPVAPVPAVCPFVRLFSGIWQQRSRSENITGAAPHYHSRQCTNPRYGARLYPNPTVGHGIGYHSADHAALKVKNCTIPPSLSRQCTHGGRFPRFLVRRLPSSCLRKEAQKLSKTASHI